MRENISGNIGKNTALRVIIAILIAAVIAGGGFAVYKLFFDRSVHATDFDAQLISQIEGTLSLRVTDDIKLERYDYDPKEDSHKLRISGIADPVKFMSSNVTGDIDEYCDGVTRTRCLWDVETQPCNCADKSRSYWYIYRCQLNGDSYRKICFADFYKEEDGTYRAELAKYE